MDKSRPAGQVLVRNIETNEILEPKMERMYHRMSGAVADSMVLYHTVYSIPMIVTEITLYHTMKRIDFSYRLVLDRIPLREAFVVFPFQMESPRFTFQGIGTPVRVFEDIVEGGNKRLCLSVDYGRSAYHGIRRDSSDGGIPGAPAFKPGRVPGAVRERKRYEKRQHGIDDFI